MTLVNVESAIEWLVTLLLQAWNAGVFVGVFEKVVASKVVAVQIPVTTAPVFVVCILVELLYLIWTSAFTMQII